MRRNAVAPVPGGRPGWIAVVVLVGVLSSTAVRAQQPPATPPPAGQPPATPPPAGQPPATPPPAGQPPATPAPAGQAQTVSNSRIFPNDAGMVLNFIKPDKTADFEMIMGKLKEALSKSEKPERKQQAAGWKVFKSADPAGANTLYVYVIDPSVKGADYQVSNILAEAFPAAEANEMLKKYADCYAQGMNILNLTILQALGK